MFVHVNQSEDKYFHSFKLVKSSVTLDLNKPYGTKLILKHRHSTKISFPSKQKSILILHKTNLKKQHFPKKKKNKNTKKKKKMPTTTAKTNQVASSRISFFFEKKY